MRGVLNYAVKRAKEDGDLFFGLFRAILVGPFEAAYQVGKKFVAHHADKRLLKV
jgi:hypothetical protein